MLNARGVALLLAVSIAVITTAFLSLVPEVGTTALLVAAILAFGSSYLLIFTTLEFVFFREINNMYEMLERIRKNEVKQPAENKSSNPLKRINQEINFYVKNKQQEIEDLKRLATFRREFLADVSHELKTPIFAAQGYIYTLLDGAVRDKNVRMKFLKKAAKSLDGLDVLVQDLLTLSQLEIGQIKMHYSYFDLVALIHEVYDQIEGKAEKKDVSLRLHPDLPLQLYVWADQQRIQQVIVNLISNAIKYASDERKERWVEVEVRSAAESKEAEVLVKDNGRGISEEHRQRIFERFYRIEKSRYKGSGGSGLGLAIVKHILEAHDTQIEVSSVPEEGSVFSFRLRKNKRKKEMEALESA